MAESGTPHRTALSCARNIVNQILDEAGTDVETRQRINDDCDQFAARLIAEFTAARIKEAQGP